MAALNALLARQCPRGRRADFRRLALAMLAVILAGAAWHALRPYLVLTLARSSVGCIVRADLVTSAVKRRYPQTTPEPDFLESDIRFRRGTTGWLVIWPTRVREATRQDNPSRTGVHRYVFLDGRLDNLGHVDSRRELDVSFCGDWDRDGRVEVTLGYALKEESYPQGPPWGWAVLRLNAQSNELAGLIVHDDQWWRRTTLTRIKPNWRDNGGSGVYDMEFATVFSGRGAGATVGFGPYQVVARLGWTAPGGVLRPSLLPDDGTVLTWSPPDGRPYSFSPDTPADTLFRELLPLPPDFGAPTSGPVSAVSQPTSATSQPTSTTSQPVPISGPD